MPGLSKEQQDRIARNRAAALERRAGKRAAVTPMSLDVPDQSSAAVASGAASAGFTAAPAARGLDAMTPDIAAHKAMEIEEELENDQIRREAAKRVRDASTATAPAVSKKTRGAREAAAEAQNSVPVGLNATMATAALMGARFASWERVSLTSLPNLTNWYRHYENGAWMCLSNLSTIPATWKN
eukprot:m.396401 g.396401  ORF g.396401 m.396401 type:complete len:184 (-) comp16772_c1_seq27:753-1304(-)